MTNEEYKEFIHRVILDIRHTEIDLWGAYDFEPPDTSHIQLEINESRRALNSKTTRLQ